MLIRLIWPMLGFFGAAMTNSDLENSFECPENGKIICASRKCDGIIDCSNGGDETFALCKNYVDYADYTDSTEEETPKFPCAYGAIPHYNNNDLMANNYTQCADESDESPALYRSLDSAEVRGSCARKEMECRSGDCIPFSKLCDNQVDCIDGRDESLEMCMRTNCIYPQFLCASGRCINATQICDNKFDCPDGSDEVPQLCKNICDDPDSHDICKTKVKKWNYIDPPRCFEPIEKGVQFSSNTKFHRIRDKRFVYANQAVKFECGHHVNGREFWNVCLNTSQWRTALPRCKKVNLDPATNGKMGCPLNYYKEDAMIILECLTYGDCTYVIKPPVDNKKVEIRCNNGYTLAGDFSFNRDHTILTCDEKKWIGGHEPRCTKFCNGTELDGLYALDAECGGCTKNELVLPGRVVNFKCAPGFLQVKREPLPQSECLDNKTWWGLEDLKRNQMDLCSYSCMGKQPSGSMLSSNGILVAALEAPWTIALYGKNNTKYLCSGVLIRLDMVLTAAHCLYTENDTKRNEMDLSVRYLKSNAGTKAEHNLPVKKYWIHGAYDNDINANDIAILLLRGKITVPVGQGIVCLPWFKGARFQYPHGFQNGVIDTWNTENQTLAAVHFEYQRTTERIRNDIFTIKANTQLCAGDSGSPVVVSCKTKHWKGRCLVGLVSRFTLSEDQCAKDITVTNITWSEQFIREHESVFL